MMRIEQRGKLALATVAIVGYEGMS